MESLQSANGATIEEPDMEPAPAPGSMVLLTRLSRVVYRRASEAVLGMTLKEYMALTNLRDQRGVTQQALADALHLDPNNCVLLLNVLESGRLAERRRDPSDRRRHIVELTPAGRQALERADRALESVEDEVLGALSRTERETLYRLLVRAVEGEARKAAREQERQLGEPVSSS
jgi:MarR family transcriptional regulator, temperature-dependent positive regulator of motility